MRIRPAVTVIRSVSSPGHVATTRPAPLFHEDRQFGARRGTPIGMCRPQDVGTNSPRRSRTGEGQQPRRGGSSRPWRCRRRTHRKTASSAHSRPQLEAFSVAGVTASGSSTGTRATSRCVEVVLGLAGGGNVVPVPVSVWRVFLASLVVIQLLGSCSEHREAAPPAFRAAWLVRYAVWALATLG